MARAVFKTIIPKALPSNLFDDAFEKASREMEKDVKGAFEDAVGDWKHKPVWRGYVRINSDQIYISVGTTDPIFKYVDEGTKAHIIKPVTAKVLHWVDVNTGEDHFAKEVHHPGNKAQKISQSIREVWQGALMADYFDKYLVQAIKESGHAI